MAISIDANDVIVRIREAGDSTWKELVCQIDESIEHTNDTTEVETKCQTFVGVKTIKGNYTGNAVHNAIPGGTEVSYNDVLNWQINRTPLEFLIENEAYTASDGTSVTEGLALHVFNTGKFVGSVLTDTTGDVVKFSWTFKPDGTPVTSGASS